MTRRIRICLPDREAGARPLSGDAYFAASLAKALEQIGFDVSFAYPKRRKGAFARKLSSRRIPWAREMDLVIRGATRWTKLGQRPLFLWLISRPSSLEEEELAEADHLFVASEDYAKSLSARGYPASYLPQCTDPDLFAPERYDETVATDILFVGNRRNGFPREIVDAALKSTDRPIAVWGKGWGGHLPKGMWRGEHVANTDLGRHYASAKVVLNDHHPDMRDHGFVSNRIFDVLASGRPIVTEAMTGIPDDLNDGVFAYEPETVGPQIVRASESSGRNRQGLAAHVRDTHSFVARAREIARIAGVAA